MLNVLPSKSPEKNYLTSLSRSLLGGYQAQYESALVLQAIAPTSFSMERLEDDLRGLSETHETSARCILVDVDKATCRVIEYKKELQSRDMEYADCVKSMLDMLSLNIPDTLKLDILEDAMREIYHRAVYYRFYGDMFK